MGSPDSPSPLQQVGGVFSDFISIEFQSEPGGFVCPGDGIHSLLVKRGGHNSGKQWLKETLVISRVDIRILPVRGQFLPAVWAYGRLHVG